MAENWSSGQVSQGRGSAPTNSPWGKTELLTLGRTWLALPWGLRLLWVNRNRTTVLDICHLPLETHSPSFPPTCAPGGVLYASVPLFPSDFLLTLTNMELWQASEEGETLGYLVSQHALSLRVTLSWLHALITGDNSVGVSSK